MNFQRGGSGFVQVHSSKVIFLTITNEEKKSNDFINLIKTIFILKKVLNLEIQFETKEHFVQSKVDYLKSRKYLKNYSDPQDLCRLSVNSRKIFRYSKFTLQTPLYSKKGKGKCRLFIDALVWIEAKTSSHCRSKEDNSRPKRCIHVSITLLLGQESFSMSNYY